MFRDQITTDTTASMDSVTKMKAMPCSRCLTERFLKHAVVQPSTKYDTMTKATADLFHGERKQNKNM